MSAATHTYEDNTSFIRLDGDDIQDGVIDIQTTINALSGTRSTFEYLLKKEDSDIAKYKDINFPIQTREGCWEIIIPWAGNVVATAATFMALRPLSAGATEYTKTIGKGIAESHLNHKSNSESFKGAFDKLHIIIKLAQHLGVIENRRHLNLSVRGKEVLLINSDGNVLSTNLDEIKIYQECPEKLLMQLASVVTDYRTLTIGYKNGGVFKESVIDIDSKELFSPEEDSHDPILPELQNGEYVILKGYVSRGNQITNTIGFKYGEHIITCTPDKQLVTAYLNAHYHDCEIKGTVIRTSPAQIALGKRDRPKILFDELSILANGNEQAKLFQNI